MDINDILEYLTPEQLEELAEKKRQESHGGKKRKQSRQQKKPEVTSGRVRKPRKKKQTSLINDDHSHIPKKGAPCRKTELQLGNRPNRFESMDEFNDNKDDIEIDQKLFNNITKRSPSRIQYVDATCSKCNNMYEDVPAHECYKDDTGIVFVCEECVGRMR